MKNNTAPFKIYCIFLILLLTQLLSAQQAPIQIDKEPFADATHHWYDIFNKQNMINALPGKPQYKPTEIREIGDNILLMQKDNGGWPKNYDVFAILTEAQKDSVRAAKSTSNTTYDNGTIFTHIAALSIVYTATKDEKYKTGALKGLDFILQSQYKNGGWPQYYPLEDNYSRCITYNDGAMAGIMKLIKDINDNRPEFAFIDTARRKQLEKAYKKGLKCILKTQIIDNGKPNAWCQQYNEVTLQPAWARNFEPPCICNKESAELVLFLMSIDHPSKKVIKAIQNAVVWFEESTIYNTRMIRIPAERVVTAHKVSTTDRIAVTDSTAPPVWARYYEIETHRPMFCDRGNKIFYTLAEVARERRDGYGFYVYSPQEVLDKYPAWQKKWAKKSVLKN